MRSTKSICHWKQQGASWLLEHPFRSHTSTEWFSWPGVLFLYLDHSLTLVGLRYRLNEQQTPQKSRSRNPQTTMIKVYRPKYHCKRKHSEMRKPAEHGTDVKQLWEMCCFPSQIDYTPTELQPGVQRQGRFLLSYANHADSLKDLRAGVSIWGDWRRNSLHKEHWHQSQ